MSKYLYIRFEPYTVQVDGKWIKKRWLHRITKMEWSDRGLCIQGINIESGDEHWHYQWYDKLPKFEKEKRRC